MGMLVQLMQYRRDSRRRGATVVMVMVSLTMLLGFAALTVDLGVLYNTRGDLQRSSDAAALAGAQALLDQNRLKGSAELNEAIAASRTEAGTYGSENAVYGLPTPTVNSSDITVGYLSDPTSSTEAFDFTDPTRFNAVHVRVRRDSAANGPVQLLFARIFGLETSNVTAEAAAALMDGIEGWRVDERTGNAGLLPIALRQSAWLDLLNGTFTSGDHYTYDTETQTVSPGPDGILELNLYPGGGAGQLPPGNFGTVDIGSPANVTPDIIRQILYGVNEADLAYFGGELRLGDDGTLPLNGDTGLSAAIASALEDIIGQPRAIPIFTTVTGPGNNATFTIVGFVGIRVMHVKLTGSMNSKHVYIQPALVVDDAALAGPASGSSYYVYQPVRLVR